LRRLLLPILGLVLISAPKIAFAQNDNNQGNEPRPHMGATEMAAMGTGAAFLVGATGYLLLRKRKSA